MELRTGYWQRQHWVRMVALHGSLNVAMPVTLMAVVSVALGRPALLDFALFSVAPWTVLATFAVITSWILVGRSGRFPGPVRIVPDVVRSAAGWAAVFAVLSVAAGSASSPPTAGMMADGGISAFMAALMSGIAIAAQTQRAHLEGSY